MDRLRKFLLPKTVLAVFFAIISAAALTAVFMLKCEQSIPAYIVYAFSAYTVTVVVLKLIPAFKALKAALQQNLNYQRYRSDMEFKTSVSLHISLAVTLFYSIVKSAAGIYYRSAWLGALAFYYIVLCAMRLVLFNHIKSRKTDIITAYKRCCLCGYMLFGLTVALAALSFYTIHRGMVIEYPWFMIYAAAGYTFYNLTVTIISLIRYRKATNPVYTSSKALSLASGLVSLYFLQASMLNLFGDGGNLQIILNYATSAAIFLFVIGMAVFMIVKHSKSIKKQQNTR